MVVPLKTLNMMVFGIPGNWSKSGGECIGGIVGIDKQRYHLFGQLMHQLELLELLGLFVCLFCLVCLFVLFVCLFVFCFLMLFIFWGGRRGQ